MTATEILRQKQRLNGPNGIRVPYPAQFSTGYDKLFLTLGTTRFISRFYANETPQALELRIWFRAGEIANLIVIERLKNLFRKYPKVSFNIDFEGRRPIIVKISKS